MKIDVDIECPYCNKVHDTTIYMNARTMTCFESWGGCGKEFPITFKTGKITVESEKNKGTCIICDKYTYDDVLEDYNGSKDFKICLDCKSKYNETIK